MVSLGTFNPNATPGLQPKDEPNTERPIEPKHLHQPRFSVITQGSGPPMRDLKYEDYEEGAWERADTELKP